jgi:ATP-dependent Clp protease ATP-binding subunit ClpA
MLSRNLEKSLHRALAHANEHRYEYATLEHLLLALTEDEDAMAILQACSVNLDRLHQEVLNYVDTSSPTWSLPTAATRSRLMPSNGPCSARPFTFEPPDVERSPVPTF